jgi:hypothetical protein
MKTIKSFIENLFKEEKYSKVEQDSFFSIWKNSEENDFWIIDENFDYENQREIYEKYKVIMNEQIMNKQKKWPYEKNTSVLCLQQIKRNDDFEKAVIIENDPFYFKKYVLLYSIEDWNQLATMNLDDFKHLIMDAEIFEKFKKNDKYHFYELLYKIVHKLHFLKINFNEKELKNINLIVAENEDDEKLDDWIMSSLLERDDIEKYIEEKMNREVSNE